MAVRRENSIFHKGLTGKGIILAAALINLFIIALVGLSLQQSFLQSRARAEMVARNLTRVLEQSLVSAMEKLDLSLLAVASEFEREQRSGGADGARLDRFLVEQKARLPDVDSLWIASSAGLVEMGAPAHAGPLPAVSDREYFMRLRDDPEAGLVISKPLQGRVTPVTGTVFARRLAGPDGSFAGIVFAVVGLDHFGEIFSKLDVGVHGSVSLRNGDYGMVVRYPTVPSDATLSGLAVPSPEFQRSVRQDPNEGLYVARASVDNVERIFSYRRLAQYDLFVIVGLAFEDYFAEWRAQAATLVALAIVFSLVSVVTGNFLHRSWQTRGLALHEAEVATSRLRAILQNLPVGLAIIGSDRGIQQANKALGDMFDVPAESLVGRSWDAMHGSRARLNDLGRRADPVILSGGTFQDVKLMHRQDGTTFWCKIRGRMLDPETPSLGVAWVLEDISEHRRNEQQLALYRSLIEYTSDCVYVISPRQGFRMVFANDAACAHYGVPRDVLLTWRLPDWDVSLQDGDSLDDFWHQVKQKRSLLIQTRHRVHPNVTVPVEMSANYLLHEGEEFIAGYFHNIVARMVAERTLMEKTQELARSNTDLEQFAYVASHDLREPLRMVSSYLGLLERRLGDQLTDEAREFIGYAKDGAERMDRLILDLLDYSRIGRVNRPLERVDLADVMAEVSTNLRARIADTGCRLEIGPSLPSVFGDRVELVRLFQNLITNAIKYRTPDRPPMVTVWGRQHRREWVIGVSDNGIGIAAQYFDRIFGIFQRLHARQDYEGTGIGLAICKKIVEHHKGRIWVESTPGEGSQFFVAFPVAAVHSLDIIPSDVILS